MAIGLDQGKKKTKKDRGGKGLRARENQRAFQREDSAEYVAEDIETLTETGIGASGHVLETMAEEAEEVAQSMTTAAESLVTEAPFVAPWSAGTLTPTPEDEVKADRTTERSTERVAERPSLQEAATHLSGIAFQAATNPAMAAVNASLETARNMFSAARGSLSERLERAGGPESVKNVQDWTDFYMRMNPMTVQIGLLRAGMQWGETLGEAYVEANRQMMDSARKAMTEMSKLWTFPFRRS